MAELHLGKRHQTEYGNRYEGFVEDGDRLIGITYREPKFPDASDTAYIYANGLSAGKGTMQLPAVEGAKAGHTTITLDYANNSLRGALDSNARNVAAVADSLDAGIRRRFIGLSEGGRVGARALELVESPFEAATFVAPAGFIANNHLSWPQGVLRLSAAYPEILGMSAKHPKRALYLGASCLKNCAQRPLGVIGEMHELRTGDEHDTLRRIKDSPEAPYLRFMYGVRDKLLQAARQRAGTAGLPLNEILPYLGGHCDITTKPEISREIYRRDEQLGGKIAGSSSDESIIIAA